MSIASKRTRIEVALLVFCVAAVIGLFWYARTTNIVVERELVRSEDFDLNSWKEYRLTAFDVSLRYPSRWELSVSEDPQYPEIRVYAPESYRPGVTNTVIASPGAQVAIFPKGIPHTAIDREPLVDPLLERVTLLTARTPQILKLESGESFAQIVHFPQVPESWGPSGFAWAQTNVGNVSAACSSSRVPCDLLFDDHVTFRGSIDEYEYAVVERILESIRFYGSVQAVPESGGVSVVIDQPSDNATVRSPLTIRGSAAQGWFFEGEVPIQVRDGNDVLIARGSGKREAIGTPEEGRISFVASISFELPETRAGTIVIEKANPVGVSALEDRLVVPILFAR